jgi:hypothetical protein
MKNCVEAKYILDHYDYLTEKLLGGARTGNCFCFCLGGYFFIFLVYTTYTKSNCHILHIRIELVRWECGKSSLDQTFLFFSPQKKGGNGFQNTCLRIQQQQHPSTLSTVVSTHNILIR